MGKKKGTDARVFLHFFTVFTKTAAMAGFWEAWVA
jgi:hypothetical protein